MMKNNRADTCDLCGLSQKRCFLCRAEYGYNHESESSKHLTVARAKTRTDYKFFAICVGLFAVFIIFLRFLYPIFEKWR